MEISSFFNPANMVLLSIVIIGFALMLYTRYDDKRHEQEAASE